MCPLSCPDVCYKRQSKSPGVQLVLPAALMEDEEDEGCCSGGSLVILQVVSLWRRRCSLRPSLFMWILESGDGGGVHGGDAWWEHPTDGCLFSLFLHKQDNSNRKHWNKFVTAGLKTFNNNALHVFLKLFVLLTAVMQLRLHFVSHSSWLWCNVKRHLASPSDAFNAKTYPFLKFFKICLFICLHRTWAAAFFSAEEEVTWCSVGSWN